MRRLSTPFIEPLARVFHNPLRRASSAEPSASSDGEAGEAVHEPEPPPQSPLPQHPPESLPRTSQAQAPALPGDPSEADIPLQAQDALYIHQLTLSKPLLLSPLAFHSASIVWRYKDSQRVYKTLQKKRIITDSGAIDTKAITKHFAHQFAYLTAFAQRRVIGLLFWWEEEVQRLRSLMEQEEEIKQLLNNVSEEEAGDGGPESMPTLLRTELTRTRMLINLRPSERAETQGDDAEQLPAYTVSPLSSPENDGPDPMTHYTAIPAH